MSEISGNKILKNIDNIINKTPVTADVFLTNYCNNKCKYCTYKRWGEPTPYAMSFDKFRQYTLKMLTLGVKGIILTGGGEPTLNPDFDKITNWLEENDISYGINTNFNVLKFCRPSYLKVSLDAFSSKSYFNIRGVDAFDMVQRNIKIYSEWKYKNGIKTSLGIQAVIPNHKFAENFYQAAKDLEVDYIVMRPIESTMGKYYMNNDNKVNRKIIIQKIEELQQLDKRIVLNFKWGKTDCKFSKCYANFSQIAVNEHGNVMYCCHKPFEIIGHIMDENILQKKNNYHTDIMLCDVPCRLTGANETIRYMETKTPEYMFI